MFSPAFSLTAALLPVVAALATVIAFALGPSPVHLSTLATGDAALAEALRARLGARPGTHALAVALIEPSGTRVVGLGASGDPARPEIDDRTAFEIGSVTKGLNGLLLADLASEGVISLEARVGDLVARPALQGSAVADATLAELAQHTSGLPRVATGGPITLLRSGYTAFAGADPYPAWTRAELFDQVARLGIRHRGTFAYSNAGAALLGHTLAVATGSEYPELLATRVLRPLGLEDTVVATQPDALPAVRARGASYTGRPRAPWTGEANAPAGTLWSTTRDMARLVRALIDGTAPGMEATLPRHPIAGQSSIGLGWFTSRIGNSDVVWHSGATGGFSAWVGFDRTTKRGVVVLSATDRRIDALALHLLDLGPPPPSTGRHVPGTVGLVMLVLLIFISIGACLSLGYTHRDRLAPASHVSNAVLGLALLWVLGPWMEIPWQIWSIAAAVTATASVALLWRTRDRPWPQSVRRYVSFAVRVALCVLVIVAIV